MEVREILEQLQRGEITVEQAEKEMNRQSFEEMGYAKLDGQRQLRTGFAEVVFCEGKADEHLLSIYQRLFDMDGRVFGTRASVHQYEMVREVFPQAKYDKISRILRIDAPEDENRKLIGKVAVCTAGTADIPVAEEAAQTDRKSVV